MINIELRRMYECRFILGCVLHSIFSIYQANFASLVKELKAKFSPSGLLVTAAVSAGTWVAESGYDVPQLAA